MKEHKFICQKDDSGKMMCLEALKNLKIQVLTLPREDVVSEFKKINFDLLKN